MKISKKCQYGMKAIFELVWRGDDKPLKTQDIAKSQKMSTRFTEIILNELRHGGFVESRRGNEGGYLLARNPKRLAIRDVIEYLEGPISVVAEASKYPNNTDFPGKEAFNKLWDEVNNAVCQVCENMSFADLAECEKAERSKYVFDYTI